MLGQSSPGSSQRTKTLVQEKRSGGESKDSCQMFGCGDPDQRVPQAEASALAFCLRGRSCLALPDENLKRQCRAWSCRRSRCSQRANRIFSPGKKSGLRRNFDALDGGDWRQAPIFSENEGNPRIFPTESISFSNNPKAYRTFGSCVLLLAKGIKRYFGEESDKGRKGSCIWRIKLIK